MNWTVTFEPLLSLTWLGATLIPLALLVLAGLLLRARGGFLRLLALAALALALFNPVLLDEEREPLQSVVALIVDRSQSQDIGDRMDQADQALEALQSRLERYPQFEVRTVEAGGPGTDDRTQTRLFGAVESAFRDVPPRASAARS